MVAVWINNSVQYVSLYIQKVQKVTCRSDIILHLDRPKLHQEVDCQ